MIAIPLHDSCGIFLSEEDGTSKYHVDRLGLEEKTCHNTKVPSSTSKGGEEGTFLRPRKTDILVLDVLGVIAIPLHDSCGIFLSEEDGTSKYHVDRLGLEEKTCHNTEVPSSTSKGGEEGTFLRPRKTDILVLDVLGVIAIPLHDSCGIFLSEEDGTSKYHVDRLGLEEKTCHNTEVPSSTSKGGEEGTFLRPRKTDILVLDVLGVIAIPLHDSCGIFLSEEDGTSKYHVDRLGLEEKTCHNTKVPSSTSNRPKEIRVLALIRSHQGPIGQNHIDFE